MGQGFLSRLKRKTEINVAVVGLYSAGKSSILHRLQEKVSVSMPTFGMVVEEITYKYFHMTSWDVGGRQNNRPLYRHYFKSTDALIFVVDSSECFFEALTVMLLHKLLREDNLHKVPMAVLANKQDLPGAMTCQKIEEILKLQILRRDRKVEIFPTSAHTGEGIHEALEWIANTVKQKDVRDTVVSPLHKAIPQPVKHLYKTLDFSLKAVFKTDQKETAIAPTA